MSQPTPATVPTRPTGRVVFIGAGPGSADLITMRGAQRLAEADVVLSDALADPQLREMAPAARWINVGKRGYHHATAQAHINALILAHAQRGLTVARLKGGDPSVFGRLEEELEVVRAEGVPCEVVPGVTAALAAAAQTQRPLTRRGRGRSVSFATAVTRDGDAQPLQRADTEVFYMAGQQLPTLSRQLQAAGWASDTPVSVVSQAGSADAIASSHHVETVGAAAALHGGRPTIVIVGVGATTIDPAVALSTSTVPAIADAAGSEAATGGTDAAPEPLRTSLSSAARASLARTAGTADLPA